MTIRFRPVSTGSAMVTLLLIGLLAPASAQSQEMVIPFQLSLTDPGARSLGFGGAFVALADDATAAFANPAGLVQLVKPEISAELRNWGYSNPFVQSGRVEGLPSGFGIDTTVGLRSATSRYDATGLSFLSLALPRGDWSIAFFRHQYADLESSIETQGLFGGGTTCCQQRMFDLRSTSDWGIVNYGLAAAYRVNDRLSVGVSLLYYDTSFDAQATEYRFDDDTIEAFFGRNSFLPSRSYVITRLSVDESSWGVAGGFLWRPSESWSVGGVYRQGAELHMRTETTAGETFDPDVPPGTVVNQGGGPIDFPDSYGLGVAYRAPGGRLTLSAQWSRVEYSDIPDSLDLDDAVVDDADLVHVGAEYVFLDSTPIVALRLGAWRDPDHQFRNTADDPFARALNRRGEDEMHFALGLGLAMRRYQVDLAVDYSDRVDTVSLSAIVSF